MNVAKTCIVCSFAFLLLNFCGCENNPNNEETSTIVDRENVVGKWVRVKSIEAWHFGPNDTGNVIDIDSDTTQLVDINTEFCTFYTLLSDEYAKQDENFSFNVGNYSAELVNDTLGITYREDQGGNNWEAETLYFIQYSGDLPPADWPTKISEEDVVLFL